MTEREYGKLVKNMAPRSPVWRDCLNAFWIGGLICTLGNAVQREIYGHRAAEAAKVTPEAMKLEINNAYKRRMHRQRKQQRRFPDFKYFSLFHKKTALL